MDITSLANKLLNDKEQAISDAGFIAAYNGFLKLIGAELHRFAVYFGEPGSLDGVANAAYLARRLEELTGVTRNNIRLVYDKNDLNIRARIKENLPYLEEYLHSGNGMEITEEFIIDGGSDQEDKFWDSLSENVRYIMSIRPYLDGEDLSFIKIKNAAGEWVTHYTDMISMNQPFAMRNFYIDVQKIRTVPENIKKYYVSEYKNLDKAETIINSSNASVFTISGLKSASSAADRGDNSVLILALAALSGLKGTLKKEGKPTLLAFTDYSDSNDRHFSLLKAFLKKELDAEKLLSELKTIYPQADENDLKTGLLNPLLQKRRELASVLENVILTDTHGSFNNGNLYICPVGGLPYDYMAALFAKSDYLFFESCDYVNLAVNLGVPFIYKSIETSSSYPDFFYPGLAEKLDGLSDIFKNDINAYIFAVNKNLNSEIDAVRNFLDKPETEYFNALKLYAQGKTADVPNIINDKLAASASVFYTLYCDMGKEPQRHFLFQNTADNIMGFEELYKKLIKAFDPKSKTLNILSGLGNMRSASYLIDLTGGKISLDSADGIAFDYYETGDEDKTAAEISGVSINNAKAESLPGGVFNVKFTDWQGGGSFGVYIDGNFNRPNNLFGIPWLKFSDFNFSVILAENNTPAQGSVGGTFGGTFGKTDDYPGVNFVIDLNRQNNTTRIMASFNEPLTAFSAFGAIAGGLDFTSLLPPALLNVVKLGLSELVFYYDTVSNKITSMNFSFANQADAPWVLWEKDGKPILTASPSIRVTVNEPADMANRSIRVNIGAFVDFGDKDAIAANGGEIGQLWLGASYPPFVVEMRMASEKISLDKILEMFGCGDIKLNMDITDLRVLADFGNSAYLLSAAVSSDWKIADGFVITGLALHVSQKSGRFSVGFAGSMRICGIVDAGVAVGYNAGTWKLSAKVRLNAKDKISDKISMSELVDAYKGGNDVIMLTGNEDDPFIAGLDFSLTKKPGIQPEFEISAMVENWEISSLNMNVSAMGTVGRNAAGFYASLKASVELLGADCVISLNYGAITSLSLEWGVFKGLISKTAAETTAVISLNNFSVGGMIETFTGWLYGSEFSLDPPWDLLRDITFDIELTYSFTNKYFKFAIKKDLDFGLGKLKGISVLYNPKAEKKIDVNLIIEYAWSKGVSENLGWDAANPGTAPAPAGMGSKYFDLRFLAFGQKVQFFEKYYNPINTDGAINELIKRTNPDVFPPYDEGSGMLVAADFGILKSEDKNKKAQYLLDAALVFYDPSLFALRIKFAGPAAKIFDGFMFEIIYAKLSETLGVFKSRVALPDKFRTFEAGAFSITLPDFYIEIYTNGDFKADIGFPKNGDFSRSLSLSGIVPPGIPVTGAIGVYFGKLSSATAESSGVYLPKSDQGVFNPAIIFGAGIRMGIGKSINYGILSGGFSVTLNVILEGVLAKWHSYTDPNSDEWYHRIEGTAGIIGNVYGKIDFAIICASVNITIGVSVGLKLESYRAIPLTIRAYVTAQASLVINLGLFKIRIGFSFSVEVKESFVIGENKKAPWDGPGALADGLSGLYIYRNADRPAVMNFSNLLSDGEITPLSGNLSLAITAAADEYEEKYNDNKKFVIGNAILTLKNEDFEVFAETMVYWLIAAANSSTSTKRGLDNFEVSDCFLSEIELYLAKGTTPVSIKDSEDFIKRFFTLNILDPENENALNGEIAGTYFPIPPATQFCPKDEWYALKDYNSIGMNALTVFKDIFNKLAVLVEEEQKRNLLTNGVMSVAELVFCDFFAFASRHIIRSMRGYLRDKERESAVLSDIIKGLGSGFYSELSGMLSRFFLHGLRLPTVKGGESLITPKVKGMWVKQDGDTLTLPKEAGIFALTGQAFIMDAPYSVPVKVRPGNGYLRLPGDFSLYNGDAKIIADCMDEFTVDYTFDEVKAEFSPEVIPYGNPAEINGKYIWNIPESLGAYYKTGFSAAPRFKLLLTDYNAKTGGITKTEPVFSPAALLEFNLEETETEGIYIIGSASKQTVDILQGIVTQKPEISSISVLNAPLFTNADNNLFFTVSQLNLSTETRPPENMASVSGRLEAILKLLWKALVTNNKGYIMTYRDEAKTKLGEKVTLAVTYAKSLEDMENNLPLVNAVLSDAEPDEGRVLMAYAEAYTVSVPPGKSPEELAAGYFTDVRRIAQDNINTGLTPGVEWHFENMEEPLKESPVTKINETLAAFAKRMNVSAAYALWLNRDKPNLFKDNIKITVQPGFRVPSGSENTWSSVNESYIIKRSKPADTQSLSQSGYGTNLLLNNYSLLTYGFADSGDNSAPHSYTDGEGFSVYTVTVPADKHFGGMYKSCGRLIRNRFNWVDYYGNKLPPAFYSSRLAGYQDTLLGLSKWPSMGARWSVRDKSSLSLFLSFRAEDYFKAGERYNEACETALVSYKRLLNQVLDDKMDVRLKSTFFTEASEPIQKDQLIKIISEIIGFFNSGDYVSGLTFDPLTFTFKDGIFTSFKLFPLECSFVMERKGFASKGFEEVREIMRSESLVTADDPRKLAEDFTSVFNGYSVLKASGSSSVYAFNISGASISVNPEKIKFYLPAPLSNKLIDRDSAELKIYDNGMFAEAPEVLNYRGVDLNGWLRDALSFADKVISPEIVSASELVTAAGYSECDYNKLLRIKESLAGKLSKMLLPAFREDSPDVPKEARELFRQRLLGRLSSFNGIKAVAALPADVNGLPEESAFFGNLSDIEKNPLTYSSIKLKNGRQNLVFAVSGADVVLDGGGAVLPSADLKLSYSITHIESGITEITDGFMASDWYGKINGDIAVLPLYGKSREDKRGAVIPFPLYSFPETPIMVSHKALEAHDMFAWRYAFTYSRSYNYPQQICHCRVRYNTAKKFSLGGANSLFIALAQINRSGSSVYYDLRALAESINHNQNILPDDDISKAFTNVFMCAYEMLAALDRADFSSADEFLRDSSGEEIEFTVTEGRDSLGRFCASIKLSNPAARASAKDIEPRIENFTSEYLTEEGCWVFKDNNGGYLSPVNGQAISKREIVMRPVEILRYQNAVSDMYIRQNEILGGKEMNEAFIFSTPAAAFDSPISPYRTVENVDLTAWSDKKDLKGILSEYLSGICKSDGLDAVIKTVTETVIEVRGTFLTSKFNNIAPIIYPVFSQTKTEIRNGDFTFVTGNWENEIRGFWKNFVSPAWGKGDTLSFEFTFYSTGGSPLLVIRNAYVDCSIMI